jgi:predicted amidohydrolase
VVKLSLAQFKVTRGDVEANLTRIDGFARTAAASGADLLCLPEMCSTGFDWRRNRALLDQSADSIGALAMMAKSHRVAICGSFLEATESGRAANCFHYFDASGRILARYRKLHLFTLFHEERHVEPGGNCVTFATPHGRFGAAICYDLRFPELFRRLTEQGARLHFLPAAFPHPRLEHWRTMIRARAMENQCFVVATNQCGVEGHGSDVGETRYFGHTMVADPWGEVVAEAGGSEATLEVEIDLARVDEVRSQLSAWADRRTDLFQF